MKPSTRGRSTNAAPPAARSTPGPVAASVWQARAKGLADSLHDAWRRGVGFTGLAPFDGTKPVAEQEAAFNRRFRPWMTDPEG